MSIHSVRGTSLLAGRSTKPLSDDEVRRVQATFLSLDEEVAREAVRFEEGSVTGFREEGEAGNPEIIFGPDIYPGTNVANPNSSLTMRAAAAHELAHYHRWRDKTQLPSGALRHVDEALTSLQAVLRYEGKLDGHERRQLIEDAMLRIHLYSQEGLVPTVVLGSTVNSKCSW